MTPVAIIASAAHGPFVAGASPVETPLAAPRARKMMSRSAYLAARCLADVLPAISADRLGRGADRTAIAYYLGVGGSAGSLDDVTPLLAAAIADDTFSLPAFGSRGLAACNPLLAFQLMNNFTMCHGAILEGLGGPNGALFSRGAGTIAAIAEAMHAVRSGEATCAITGGADVATHPVTLAELAREGRLARGLIPADGAALLALGSGSGEAGSLEKKPGEAGTGDDVILEGCAHASGRGRAIGEAIDDALARARAPGTPSTVVLAAWGPPAADVLASYAAARFPGAVVDRAAPGETLAAGPALAVVEAARALTTGQRTLVLTLGVDGDPGVVVLSRGAS